MERPAHSPTKSPLNDRDLEIYWLKVVDVSSMIDHELAARDTQAAGSDEAPKVDAPVV